MAALICRTSICAFLFGVIGFAQLPTGNEVWDKLSHRSGWIFLGQLQLHMAGGQQIGWGAWEQRYFRSLPKHTKDATKVFPSKGDRIVLKQATRLFVAGFQNGDIDRWSDFPVEGGYLWNTTSDTGLDLPSGIIVEIEEVKAWFANTAALNTILARVASTGS